jgi:hypothetical protein
MRYYKVIGPMEGIVLNKKSYKDIERKLLGFYKDFLDEY